MSLSVILIGAGRIAVGNRDLAGEIPLSHAAAVAAVGPEIAEIAAIVEADDQKRGSLEQAGYPVFARLADVPRHRDEVVVICTPSAIRKAPVVEAVRRGVSAIVVEKPLAVSLEEAASLNEVAAAAGVPLFVNFNRRTDERIAKHISAVAGMTPSGVTVSYGRGMSNYASHALDLITCAWGAIGAVRWLSGAIGSNEDPSPTFVASLECGVIATFMGHEGLDYDLLDIVFTAKEGMVVFDTGGAEVTLRLPEDGRHYKGYRHLADEPKDAAPVTGFVGLYRSLARTLASGDSPLICTGQQAVDNAAVLEAVRLSAARMGQPVVPQSLHRETTSAAT